MDVEDHEPIDYGVHGAVVPFLCMPGGEKTIIDDTDENDGGLHFHASCLKGIGVVFGKPGAACFYCGKLIVFSPEDPGRPSAGREIVAFLPCIGGFDGGLERARPVEAGFGVYLHPACYGAWKKQFEG